MMEEGQRCFFARISAMRWIQKNYRMSQERQISILNISSFTKYRGRTLDTHHSLNWSYTFLCLKPVAILFVGYTVFPPFKSTLGEEICVAENRLYIHLNGGKTLQSTFNNRMYCTYMLYFLHNKLSHNKKRGKETCKNHHCLDHGKGRCRVTTESTWKHLVGTWVVSLRKILQAMNVQLDHLIIAAGMISVANQSPWLLIHNPL